MKTITHKGFTLLEILLVITLLSIIAIIVVRGSNPNLLISRIQDNQRETDALTIYQAIEQYAIKNNAYPTAIMNMSNDSYSDICKSTATTCVSPKINLSSILVPTYISKIPEYSDDAYNSGFYIVKDANGKIGVGGVKKVDNTTFVKGLDNQSFAINLAPPTPTPTPTPIPTPTIVENGLVLHLDAGNTSGTTWTDLSGNNNNGTLVNGPTYSSDNGGNFNFNGSNQFATVANGAEILNQNTYTKCVWFSPAVTNRGNNLIAGNSSKPHTLWMNNTNKLYAGHSEAGGGFTQVGPTTNIDANSWYFASATFNDGVYDTVSATGWKLYVNGNEEAASSTTQRFGDTAAPVWIASYGGGFLFQGRIAIVMIYDRVLTPAEIQQNFNVTKSRFGL